jgi:probable DNA metabolism protein
MSCSSSISQVGIPDDTATDMHQDEGAVYIYDGSLEGLLTGIFKAFEQHERLMALATEEHLQLSLFRPCRSISTDEGCACRVRRGISSRLGEGTYESVRRVFSSDDPDKGIIIYRYLLLLFKQGRQHATDRAHPAVAAFDGLERQVGNEIHQWYQFIRFSRMSNGIYVARITPKANVVPHLMAYFAARFNVQPFLIYDEVHAVVGVFDQQDWRLVITGDLTFPEEETDEIAYQRMWKRFYDAICNEERHNPGLRRQLMPKRFWSQMSEMNPLL